MIPLRMITSRPRFIATQLSMKIPFTILCVAGGLATGILGRTGGDSSAAVPGPSESAREASSGAEGDSVRPRSDDERDTIVLPRSQWEAAGIRIEPAARRSVSETIRLTGKVELNEDRLAHVYPMVEGTVDEVNVALGDVVEQDRRLVVVHSRELGTAKLELFQAELHSELAAVKDELQRELTENTRELLESLRERQEIAEIETRFGGRNMGEYRERLIAPYANFIKSEADVTRLSDIDRSGAVAGKQLLAARMRRNADHATFQARIEQIDFELRTSLLSTAQAVKEANTRVAVAATNLRILGCGEDEIRDIDPIRQGEAISHYFVRAPFHGTVIAKDVTLGEQVRPDTQILTIADLSSVWIEADIYEKDVPLLESLAGTAIRVVSEAWPDQSFPARVFFTGEIMDESTRTIGMRAIAKNVERRLKPGMFVTVELPAVVEGESIRVPAGAVQRHEDEHFVFVHIGGERFRRREVTVGRTTRQWAVIATGLEDHESVVTEGGFILKSKMLESLLAED